MDEMEIFAKAFHHFPDDLLSILILWPPMAGTNKA